MTCKILHSVYRYFPAMGGVEDYVRNLAERHATKHEVSVVCTDVANHFSSERLENVSRDEEVGGVSITRCALSPFKIKCYPTSLDLLKTLWKKDCDVVHSHSFMYPSGDYAALKAFFQKKPLVFNPYLADEGHPSFFGRVYRKTMGELLMRADCVVVISPFERMLLEKWGYSNVKRIEEIPPGIDLLEFEAIDYNAFEIFGVHNPKRILCAGRLDPNKGLDVAIDALALMIKDNFDLSLTIVGPNFGYQSELEKQVKRLNLGEHVHFLGPVSREDLCSLYKHATVFAFPTHYEAFGIVAAEAMAAETPVVATRTASLPYVVKDEETGFLFEKNNAKDLANKIAVLLENEELCRTMGASGRAHVAASYNWDRVAEKLEEVYLFLGGNSSLSKGSTL